MKAGVSWQGVEGLRSEALSSTFQIETAVEFTRFTRGTHTPPAKSEGGDVVGDLVQILDEVIRILRPVIELEKVCSEEEARLAASPVHDAALVREVWLNILANATRPVSGPSGPADVPLRSAVLDRKQAFRVAVTTRLSFAAPPGVEAKSAGESDSSMVGPSDSDRSICRELVERSRGALTADSQVPGDPSQGATYGVIFPAV